MRYAAAHRSQASQPPAPLLFAFCSPSAAAAAATTAASERPERVSADGDLPNSSARPLPPKPPGPLPPLPDRDELPPPLAPLLCAMGLLSSIPICGLGPVDGPDEGPASPPAPPAAASSNSCPLLPLPAICSGAGRRPPPAAAAAVGEPLGSRPLTLTRPVPPSRSTLPPASRSALPLALTRPPPWLLRRVTPAASAPEAEGRVCSLLPEVEVWPELLLLRPRASSLGGGGGTTTPPRASSSRMSWRPL